MNLGVPTTVRGKSANFGRDHHPRCFTSWIAGEGIAKGTVYGETDEFGYNLAKDGVNCA